jgi:lipopolysaccharide export LptBFGC system permease protein LptF
MLRTLQSYVTRELFKTFALTAIGLTLTFSLCGGVLNMIQAEVLTTLQMARILTFVMPVALTLTLPVSALFACAMVYGRLASDNETDACKASGINIHRLLWPAIWLSIFTASFTFISANFLIPTLIEKLDSLVRRDGLEKIALQALTTRGYIHKDPYVLYARESRLADNEGDRRIIDIRNAAFIELEGDSLKSCGTAEAVRVDFFNKTETGNPLIAASMFDVRAIDIRRNQFYHEKAQPIQSVEIPSTIKRNLKWLTLFQLYKYRKDLTQLPEIKEHVAALRWLVFEASLFKYAISKLQSPTKVLTLEDGDRKIEIRAERATHNVEDFHPELSKVKIIEKVPGYQREYKGDRCSIRLKRGFGEIPSKLQITLKGNAGFVDSRAPKDPVERKEVDLDALPVPPEITAEAERISDRHILGLNDELDLTLLQKQNPDPLDLGPRIEDARVSTRKDLVKLSLEIAGIIHSRIAFSASALVMLVLAAGLGIIYRGGQMLTAFVISFVPGLFVVVMNIMGKQLAENYGTRGIGILVIWGGIALIAIADSIVLTRYLRR